MKLSFLYVLSYGILSTTLIHSTNRYLVFTVKDRYCYYLHLTNEETRAQRSSFFQVHLIRDTNLRNFYPLYYIIHYDSGIS